MVSLVFLNLFIAIILEGFAKSQSESKIRIKDDSFEAFIHAWSKYDKQAKGVLDSSLLEDLIMDLIVEEIEIMKKKKVSGGVNFNLSKFKGLLYYTKWKRNIISEKERQTFFKDIEKKKLRKRQLRREMRRFIQELQIPLYFSFHYVQFHDTLNALIRRVYIRLHEKDVSDRRDAI